MRLMILFYYFQSNIQKQQEAMAVLFSAEQRPLCRCRRSQVQRSHILTAQVSFLIERQFLRRIKNFPLQETKCRWGKGVSWYTR